MRTDTQPRRRDSGDGTAGADVRSQHADLRAGSERDAPDPPGRRTSERIVRTATEARQGEIILGRWGRWIWIGSFALLVILILALGLWK
jgi:hypothetical protein